MSPTICYEDKRFTVDASKAVQHARAICAEYAAQQYNLTLRQVYYQFVARGLFPEHRTYIQVGRKWGARPGWFAQRRAQLQVAG